MKGTMTTSILSPKILLIQNDPAGADKIRVALAATGSGSFDVEWVRQLSQGLARLSKGGIDAVLLELSLPALKEGYGRRRLVRRGIPIRTDTYVVDDNLIWGATARILSDLLDRIGQLL